MRLIILPKESSERARLQQQIHSQGNGYHERKNARLVVGRGPVTSRRARPCARASLPSIDSISRPTPNPQTTPRLALERPTTSSDLLTPTSLPPDTTPHAEKTARLERHATVDSFQESQKPCRVPLTFGKALREARRRRRGPPREPVSEEARRTTREWEHTEKAQPLHSSHPQWPTYQRQTLRPCFR
jgi:hypothetical protein